MNIENYEALKRWITEEACNLNESVLLLAEDGDITYAAIENKATREVRAIVVFPHKIYSEDAGPTATTCPPEILALLTPTNNEYARSWRESCRINLIQGETLDWILYSVLRPGDEIEFASDELQPVPSRLEVVDAANYEFKGEGVHGREYFLRALHVGRFRVFRDGHELNIRARDCGLNPFRRNLNSQITGNN